MRVNDKMLGGKDTTPHAHAHLVFVFGFTVNFIKVWLWLKITRRTRMYTFEWKLVFTMYFSKLLRFL